MPEIRIIHTSDFHDRLTPEKAARLRAIKEEHDALLIDTGDAVRAANVTMMPWRERTIALMNEAGYDAMGLGNREYFFRSQGMAWKTGHASFPRVCANLRAHHGDLPGIEPWVVLPLPPSAPAVHPSPIGRGDGGEACRTALFALMPTMVEPGHWFERLSDNRFVPWQDAARQAVSALAEHADLIVASFHRPPEEIPELLALCPEVRLVLAGHGHVTPDVRETGDQGPFASFVGEGASQARLIGLRSSDGTVTMDRLIDLA